MTESGTGRHHDILRVHLYPTLQAAAALVTPWSWRSGTRIALYANTAMRAAVAGMQPVLRHLREHGDTRGLDDRIISWAERQSLVRKPAYDALDAKYATPEREDDAP